MFTPSKNTVLPVTSCPYDELTMWRVGHAPSWLDSQVRQLYPEKRAEVHFFRKRSCSNISRATSAAAAAARHWTVPVNMDDAAVSDAEWG